MSDRGAHAANSNPLPPSPAPRAPQQCGHSGREVHGFGGDTEVGSAPPPRARASTSPPSGASSRPECAPEPPRAYRAPPACRGAARKVPTWFTSPIQGHSTRRARQASKSSPPPNILPPGAEGRSATPVPPAWGYALMHAAASATTLHATYSDWKAGCASRAACMRVCCPQRSTSDRGCRWAPTRPIQ